MTTNWLFPINFSIIICLLNSTFYNSFFNNSVSTHSSPRASTASTGSNSSGTSAINKKPAMTKRKTSKLSVVTLKNGLQNINSSGISSGTGNGNDSSNYTLDSAGTGLNSTATSAVGTPSAELSPAMRNITLPGGTSPLRSASPRSPYRGDFWKSNTRSYFIFLTIIKNVLFTMMTS